LVAFNAPHPTAGAGGRVRLTRKGRASLVDFEKFVRPNLAGTLAPYAWPQARVVQNNE
jgi:hypothetical protein